jgi:O-antigen ligase
MALISILIILISIPLTWWRPGIGLALAANAYLITGSLPGQAEGLENNNLLNILLPIVVFILIFIRAFPRLGQYRFHPLDAVLGSLGVWLFFSCLQTPAMAQGLDIVTRYFVLGSSFYFVARLIPLTDPKRVEENITLTIGTYWVMAVILGSIALFNLLSSGYTFTRVSVGTINPIPFSLLVASGIIVNAYWLIGSQKVSPYLKLGLYVSMGLLMVVLMASNTRSMVIALMVSLPVMVFQIIRQQALVKSITTILVAVMGIVVLLVGIAAWQPELYDSWSGRLSLITQEKKGASVDERMTAYDAAYDLFQKSPVFGVGTGNFNKASGGTLGYAHNLSLEILSEQGIAGAFIFVCMIGFAIHLMIQANPLARFYPVIYLFSSWSILCLIVSQFSFTLWQQKNLFLSLALLVTAYYHQKHGSRPSKMRFLIKDSSTHYSGEN